MMCKQDVKLGIMQSRTLDAMDIKELSGKAV
jgi:hypothetical protein